MALEWKKRGEWHTGETRTLRRNGGSGAALIAEPKATPLAPSQRLISRGKGRSAGGAAEDRRGGEGPARQGRGCCRPGPAARPAGPGSSPAWGGP